jgi:hypothetical protein
MGSYLGPSRSILYGYATQQNAPFYPNYPSSIGRVSGRLEVDGRRTIKIGAVRSLSDDFRKQSTQNHSRILYIH